MVNEKVLLVEDEQGIRELIQLYLENRNYVVIPTDSGEQAIKLVQSEHPEIILLDIEMPGIDGFEVCQRVRKLVDIPIIFISSRRDVMDKVRCFDLGGDDYITKPFDFVELEARMKANIRRYTEGKQQVTKNVIQYGKLKINLDSYECFLNGEQIVLSTKEMQVLITLAKHPNQVWSMDQLYDNIWGFESTGDTQTIKVHISNLRRKLERNPSKPRYIQTVRGFGYRFANSSADL